MPLFRIYVIYVPLRLARTEKILRVHGHVVALDSLSDSQLNFYDSFGRFAHLPYPRVKNILERVSRTLKRQLVVNTVVHQNKNSSVCAYYSLFWLLLRARGYSMKEILKTKFSRDSFKNLSAIPAIIQGLLPVSSRLQKKKREFTGGGKKGR